MRKNTPNWFPNAGSWMSAIFLLLLTGFLAVAIQYTYLLGFSFSTFANAPRVVIPFLILALLLPIISIAFTHHFLHLFLDRFFPDTDSSHAEEVRGYFPNLISWWEGLYGWMVLILATLIASGVLVFIYNSYSIVEQLLNSIVSWDKTKHILTVPAIVWVMIAAYLYHFDHLLRQRFMAAGRR